MSKSMPGEQLFLSARVTNVNIRTIIHTHLGCVLCVDKSFQNHRTVSGTRLMYDSEAFYINT